jgi:hypothetical protein
MCTPEPLWTFRRKEKTKQNDRKRERERERERERAVRNCSKCKRKKKSWDKQATICEIDVVITVQIKI